MNITPIHGMGGSSNNNSLFIKRDDLFPFSFGGNKARKAILFFEDIKKTNSNCIVTYGSDSSNHCRVIANMAAAKKIPCYIISPSETLTKKMSYNATMIKVFATKIINCPLANVKETIDDTLQKLKNRGYKPYFIQGGGHGNIGTQAYVDTYREIICFERNHGINFDYIFHASGTGTTQAGLICGKLLNADNKKIVGISIARKNPYGGKIVFDSVNSYLESISGEKTDMSEIVFVDQYVLNGYGSYNQKILATIKDVLIGEGIPLDATYTGKAFWGMKNYIAENEISGKNILFIHTGGTPLFFDNLGEMLNG